LLYNIEIHLTQQSKEEKVLMEEYPDFFEPTMDVDTEVGFFKMMK